MDRPKLLVLVRHAESIRNVAKKGNIYFINDETRRLVAGIPDPEIAITDEGWAQAEATGLALKKIVGDFDFIYHSGYKRTIQTVEGILKAYPVDEYRKVRKNFFIRERDSGYAYDMTTEEAEAAFPWLKEYWKTVGPFYARPPGGESLAELCERVNGFISEELRRKRVGKRILIVTHGHTLKAFRVLLEHWNHLEAVESFKTDPPRNCGVTNYEYDSGLGRLVLKQYNQIYW